MGQERRYVSQDPNFGQAPERKYVSTDPNFGEPLRVATRTPSETLAGATGIGAAPNRLIEALPTIGGMAGGLVGGGKSNPFGMLLAATGGAGGEGVRQALSAISGDWERVPPDAQSQMTAILTEGVKQGGIEGAGRYVLGPIMKIFGRAMYRSALKPPVAVRQEFGGKEVTNTLVDAGIPITRTGRGTEQVEGMLKAAGKDTADTIAKQRSASGLGSRPGTIRPVLKSLKNTQAEIDKGAVRAADSEKVQQFRDTVLRENPDRMGASRMQQMKQAEQDLALNAYKAEMRGAPVNSLETSMHEDLARGLREAIERRIPSIADKNKRTQDIIGALKAITAAEGRIANNNLIGMGDLLSLGTGLGAAAATGRPSALAMGVLQEVLTRPEIASRLGIVMDRAGKPQITPQMLRTLNEAVNQVTAAPTGSRP